MMSASLDDILTKSKSQSGFGKQAFGRTRKATSGAESERRKGEDIQVKAVQKKKQLFVSVSRCVEGSMLISR